MAMHEFIEQTVVLVKPDGVKRGLIGEILSRFEKVGFKVVAMKMVWVDRDRVAKHYKDEKEYLTNIGKRTLEDYQKFGFDAGESLGTSDAHEIGKLVRNWNMDALSSGPLVALLLEGINAVEIVRKMVGPTNVTIAPAGTIRGDFSIDTPVLATMKKRPIKTIVHASGNHEEAEFERKLWFKEKEIYKYKRLDEED
jgi:nucleoside-diphosphate kinase